MDPRVRAALERAGWHDERRVDPAKWIGPLEGEGFLFHDLARSVLARFGGLRIEPPFSDRGEPLVFDPLHASSGWVGLADMLVEDYGEIYSPICEWSEQYQTYLGETGHVIALGPGWDWELGTSVDELFEFAILKSHGLKCIKVRPPATEPWPP